MDNAFGQLLQRWMERERLNQPAAARRLGTSSQNISRWLSGSIPQNPTFGRVFAIIAPPILHNHLAEDQAPYNLSPELQRLAQLERDNAKLQMEKEDLTRRLRAIQGLAASNTDIKA